MEWDETPLEQLRELVDGKKLQLYSDFEEAKELVTQVLQSDPRPGYMQLREGDHDFHLDRMRVFYHITLESATVKRIEYVESYKDPYQ